MDKTKDARMETFRRTVFDKMQVGGKPFADDPYSFNYQLLTAVGHGIEALLVEERRSRWWWHFWNGVLAGAAASLTWIVLDTFGRH